ncbi:MAG: cyclase family protein [Rhodospirillales bacterium]|nr:cyclase [Rhodospirillaceae bacterium]MDP6428625.1 cyclase family protein [Rhodospirillales bacterium]MDP6645038.1 cyclase family protein [Rhodospirillales bacterium]MDP6842266.1 cyclase family protein [Rhodospirillales bacterium]
MAKKPARKTAAKPKTTRRKKKGLTKADILRKGQQLSNWGKWGRNDELGVLNYIKPQDIVAAAKLIRKGKTFRLGLNLDENGPQRGLFGGRWNPLHNMLATGTDALQGLHDKQPGLQYADDFINLPTQAATQWDALSHVFVKGKMWNGYDAKLVDSKGAHKNGIEKFADKMVGRGVLLDVARFKGKARLADGYGISNRDLDRTAKSQGVEIRRGDFVLINTGQMADCLDRDDWGGYGGGDAPGLAFETVDWIHEKQIAGICSDTWGIEVRPNQTSDGTFQPWHWVTIPYIGIVHGEIWYLRELVADCAKDGVYEFFLAAPPLVITGGTGSPLNPQAIK